MGSLRGYGSYCTVFGGAVGARNPDRRGLRGGDERAGDGIGEVVLFPERVVDGVPPTARDPALHGANFRTKTARALKIDTRKRPTPAGALGRLAATANRLEAVLGAVAGVALETAADGGWSSEDVAPHLLISEDQGAVGRFRAIAGSNDAHRPSYDEQAELERSEWRRTSAPCSPSFGCVERPMSPG